MSTPSIARPRTFALAGLGAAALLVGTTVVPAHAAPVQGGTASQGENVVRGGGSGTAQADVDAGTGAMDLTSSARGGNGALGLPIPILSGPTSAGASGTVSQRLGVYDEGTYEIVVTFANASSSGQTRGTGSTSELRSVFGGVDCLEDCSGFEDVPNGLEPAGRFDEMPDGTRTVTSTIVVRVPDGRTAALYANVSVSASATAHRSGNTATSHASVDAITTEVVER